MRNVQTLQPQSEGGSVHLKHKMNFQQTYIMAVIRPKHSQEYVLAVP